MDWTCFPRRLARAAALSAGIGAAIVGTNPVFGADPDPSVVYDQAIKTYNNGNPSEALRALEQLLARTPDDPHALFSDAFMHADTGQTKIAVNRLEHLVELYPNYFGAWELLTQLYQDLGALPQRDSAIANLHRIYQTVSTPRNGARTYFIREKIALDGRVYVVRDVLYPGNGTIYRYIFIPISELTAPRHIIALRSVAALNQVWREAGKLNDTQRLFTLDRLDIDPAGGTTRETFQAFINEPDYDQVRTQVLAILSGKAEPLSTGPDNAPTATVP